MLLQQPSSWELQTAEVLRVQQQPGHPTALAALPRSGLTAFQSERAAGIRGGRGSGEETQGCDMGVFQPLSGVSAERQLVHTSCSRLSSFASAAQSACTCFRIRRPVVSRTPLQGCLLGATVSMCSEWSSSPSLLHSTHLLLTSDSFLVMTRHQVLLFSLPSLQPLFFFLKCKSGCVAVLPQAALELSCQCHEFQAPEPIVSLSPD